MTRIMAFFYQIKLKKNRFSKIYSPIEINAYSNNFTKNKNLKFKFISRYSKSKKNEFGKGQTIQTESE